MVSRISRNLSDIIINSFMKSNAYFLTLFSNTWTWPHFQMIY